MRLCPLQLVTSSMILFLAAVKSSSDSSSSLLELDAPLSKSRSSSCKHPARRPPARSSSESKPSTCSTSSDDSSLGKSKSPAHKPSADSGSSSSLLDLGSSSSDSKSPAHKPSARSTHKPSTSSGYADKPLYKVLHKPVKFESSRYFKNIERIRFTERIASQISSKKAIGKMNLINVLDDGNCGFYSFFAATYHLFKLENSDFYKLFFDTKGYGDLQNNINFNVKFHIPNEFAKMKKELKECKTMHEFAAKHKDLLTFCTRCFIAKWVLRNDGYARRIFGAHPHFYNSGKGQENDYETPRGLSKCREKFLGHYFVDPKSFSSAAWVGEGELEIFASELHLAIAFFTLVDPTSEGPGYYNGLRPKLPKKRHPGVRADPEVVYIVLTLNDHIMAICP